MLDKIFAIDQEFFLYLNNLGTEQYDSFFIFFTNAQTWYIGYAVLLIFLIYKYKSKSIAYIATIVLAIALTDQLCSGILKPWVGRLRPCHQEQLNGLFRLLVPCSGKFSFCSSHSGNSFALATTIFLIFKNQQKYLWPLFIWASLVAYSRVYVGVHFPFDIFCGGLIGVVMAKFVFFAMQRVFLVKFP